MTMKKTINEFRRRNGVCPASSFDINCAPILGNYSSLVVPHPDDYPSQVITTGYWILDPSHHRRHHHDEKNNDNNDNEDDKNNELEENEKQKRDGSGDNDDDVEFNGKEIILEFLDRIGEKPIYMGFGSMPLHSVSKIVEMLLSVCIKLKKHAIFCGRYTENEQSYLQNHPEGQRILLLKGAPHEWLLPRCSMAIHHGGAGTTAASMRALIPTIIYPVLIDQPFWAARIVDLKVGQSDVVELRNINEAHLMKEIQHCLKATTINNARVVGEKLRNEDGCALAAKKMVSYFTQQFKNYSRIKMNYKDIKWSGNGNCSHCLNEFGIFNLPSNCMVCGDLYCSKCLKEIWLANYGYDHQEVCIGCDSERNNPQF